MTRIDRWAVRYAMLALSTRAKAGLIGLDDLAQADGLTTTLTADDPLRCGFENFRLRWPTARRDRDARYLLAMMLESVVERDQTMRADCRDAA